MVMLVAVIPVAEAVLAPPPPEEDVEEFDDPPPQAAATRAMTHATTTGAIARLNPTRTRP
jgi:hypothetical protein